MTFDEPREAHTYVKWARDKGYRVSDPFKERSPRSARKFDLDGKMKKFQYTVLRMRGVGKEGGDVAYGDVPEKGKRKKKGRSVSQAKAELRQRAIAQGVMKAEIPKEDLIRGMLKDLPQRYKETQKKIAAREVQAPKAIKTTTDYWETNPEEIRKIATKMGIPADKPLPKVLIMGKEAGKEYSKTPMLHKSSLEADKPSGYVITIPESMLKRVTKKGKETNYILGTRTRENIQHELAHYLERSQTGEETGEEKKPYDEAIKEIKADIRAGRKSMPLALAQQSYGLQKKYGLSDKEAFGVIEKAAKDLGVDKGTITRARDWEIKSKAEPQTEAKSPIHEKLMADVEGMKIGSKSPETKAPKKIPERLVEDASKLPIGSRAPVEKKSSAGMIPAKWTQDWQEKQVRSEIEEYKKANPGKELLYHGGGKLEGGWLSGGYLTTNIDEAMEYASREARTGEPKEAFVYVVDKAKAHIGRSHIPNLPENVELLKSARYMKSFDIMKDYSAKPEPKGTEAKKDTRISSRLQPLAQEAAKYNTFDDFEKAFSHEIKHGRYYHVTDSPDFKIDPNVAPRDMSSMAGGATPEKGKLMITSDLDYWAEEYKGARKYVAVIDMSQVPKEKYYQVNRGFGNEFMVDDPSKAKVIKVIPMSRAKVDSRLHHKALPSSKEELKDFYEKAKGASKKELAKAKKEVKAARKEIPIQPEISKKPVAEVQPPAEVKVRESIKKGERIPLKVLREHREVVKEEREERRKAKAEKGERESREKEWKEAEAKEAKYWEETKLTAEQQSRDEEVEALRKETESKEETEKAEEKEEVKS